MSSAETFLVNFGVLAGRYVAIFTTASACSAARPDPATPIPNERRNVSLEGILSEQQLAPVKNLLSNPAQAEIVEDMVAFRWRAWVETWLSYDPAKAARRRVATFVFPRVMGAEGTNTEISFDGRMRDGRARLTATSRLQGVRGKRLVAALLDARRLDLDSLKVSGSHVANVDSDWPNVRPYRVQTRKDHESRSAGQAARGFRSARLVLRLAAVATSQTRLQVTGA